MYYGWIAIGSGSRWRQFSIWTLLTLFVSFLPFVTLLGVSIYIVSTRKASLVCSRVAIDLHGAFVVLLPLSLIIIFFGEVVGIVSVFTQTFCLLLFTGVLFLLGALVTLLGVSIYIAYSAALFKHVASFQGRKTLMENLSIQFGWSLAFAWVSIGTGLLTGLAFVLLAKMLGQKRRWDNFI